MIAGYCWPQSVAAGERVALFCATSAGRFDVEIVRQNTALPVLIGSGATPDNLPNVYAKVDGLIVGSYFKRAGKADNLVEEARVKTFTEALAALGHAPPPRDEDRS